MSFRNHTNPPALTVSWEGKLRDFLDRRMRAGRDGVNRSIIYEKKRPDDIVTINYGMNENIIQLGSKVREMQREMDYRTWGAWMHDAEISEGPEKVIIWQHSSFYNDYTQKQLGAFLNAYFAPKKVEYRVDRNIWQKLYA